MNSPFTERPAFAWLVGGTYLALCIYFAYGFLVLKENGSIYGFWLFWIILACLPNHLYRRSILYRKEKEHD